VKTYEARTAYGRLRRSIGRLAVRRDDAAQVLRLAYPVILGMTSYTLLSVVDTAMLGRLGAAPLAASGIAGVLFFAIVFSLSSISVGVQTLSARRFGEGNTRECGAVTNAGLAIGSLVGLPLTLAAPWLARWLAPVLSPDVDVVRLGEIYLHYRLWGAAAMLLNWVLRGFFAAVGETRHQMAASIVTTAANVLLDYALIFGRFGFPRLEVAGAAIASSVAIAVGTLYLAAIAFSRMHRSRFGVLRPPLGFRRWAGPIVRLSLPVLGQRALSNGSWLVFFTVVSSIGTIELAATNVIRSIYNLTIMLGVGFGTASAALVGQRLGAGEREGAARLGWEAAKLAALSMGVTGILFLAAPRILLRLFTADPAVVSAGATPLFLIGFVQSLAGVALVLTQSLQGAGNTRFVMFGELAICGGLYLPAVYVLGLRTPLGLVGAWTGEFLYWTALAALMAWKFARGDWKHIVL
jgi:putative MATE family efflux protein